MSTKRSSWIYTTYIYALVDQNGFREFLTTRRLPRGCVSWFWSTTLVACKRMKHHFFYLKGWKKDEHRNMNLHVHLCSCDKTRWIYLGFEFIWRVNKNNVQDLCVQVKIIRKTWTTRRRTQCEKKSTVKP